MRADWSGDLGADPKVRSARGNHMGHKDYDELREDRIDQEKHRQDLRDEAFDEADGAADDLGSQDERRKEGLGRA